MVTEILVKIAKITVKIVEILTIAKVDTILNTTRIILEVVA